MTIVRSILAVFVGLILLSISADLVEQVGRSVYPIPSAVEQARIRYAETLESHESGIAGAGEVAEARGGLRDAVVEYLGSAPAGALVFVVISWIIGGFVGAAVAAFLTPVWRIPTVVVIGVLEAVGIVAMVLEVPHPTWMVVVGLIGAMAATVLAGILVDRVATSRNATPAA